MLLSLEFDFRNTSEDAGQELLDELTKIPEVQQATGNFIGYATKGIDPSQFPWYEMFVHVKPYVIGAGAYVAVKVSDRLLEDIIDCVKRYFIRDTTSKEKRRATIYGPDGEIAGIVEIEDNRITCRRPTNR